MGCCLKVVQTNCRFEVQIYCLYKWFIPWWFKVTFLGWLSDPFKGLSDLQLGDEKGTLNHLVYINQALACMKPDATSHCCLRHFWDFESHATRQALGACWWAGGRGGRDFCKHLCRRYEWTLRDHDDSWIQRSVWFSTYWLVQLQPSQFNPIFIEFQEKT